MLVCVLLKQNLNLRGGILMSMVHRGFPGKFVSLAVIIFSRAYLSRDTVLYIPLIGYLVPLKFVCAIFSCLAILRIEGCLNSTL